MPVARSTLLERPYQTVNSSANAFYRACVVPFSFIIITRRHLSEYIDPATMIIKMERADNKCGRSSGQPMYLSINCKDIFIFNIVQEFKRKLLAKNSFCIFHFIFPMLSKNLKERKLLAKKFILYLPCFLTFCQLKD